jgi:outer membrane lipoprotein-sorting protein
MKKILLISIAVFGSALLSGCFKYGGNDLVNDLNKKVTNASAYHLEGELEIINNEDTYQYQVDIAYEKDDQFRVSLKNKNNNHEQIILKNEDGVYVLTPSLNKSFKFQSEWPYNNSQIYLLQTLVRDLKNDKKLIFKEKEDGYVLTTKVNYASNKNLVKQNIYVDKKLNITAVHVLNADNQVQMKMSFTKVDMKAKYNDNYFALKENMQTIAADDTATPVTKIDTITYPMYMPENTHLAGQDKVTKEDGERIILTFDGDKPFMIVQENATIDDEALTIPVYGEPFVLTDTIGSVSDTSANWISNGIEYYVISDTLTQEELIAIAQSISVMPVGK